MQAWHAPPMQTLLAAHAVPSSWLPTRTHAGCPPEQSVRKIPHGAGVAGEQTMALEHIDPSSGPDSAICPSDSSRASRPGAPVSRPPSAARPPSSSPEASVESTAAPNDPPQPKKARRSQPSQRQSAPRLLTGRSERSMRDLWFKGAAGSNVRTSSHGRVRGIRGPSRPARAIHHARELQPRAANVRLAPPSWNSEVPSIGVTPR